MMQVVRGERWFGSAALGALWRAAGPWGCGVALAVAAGAVPAAAQVQTQGESRAATTLAAQAAVALGATAPGTAAASAAPADDPPDKEKPAGEDADDAAGDTGGFVQFFKQTELTGFVDAYYDWNFNRTSPIAFRNFDVNHNEFSFNLAEVALEKKPTADSRVGFRADFVAGPTATLVNAFEPGGPQYMDNIQQAYASVLAPLGKGLQIDFGKFVTPHGAEVIETRDNWNYSRSLLFALAIPYYHMGARLAYPITDKVAVTGFIVNGWNDVQDNNSAKTVGAAISIKPNDRFSLIQNYMVGAEQPDDNDDVRHLFDTVVSYTLTSKVSLLGNYDYGRDNVAGESVDWTGVAGYLKYQHNDRLAFIPRFEVLWDSKAFTTGTPQTLKDLTLTGEYKFAGLVTRLEYRTDFSDELFFSKSDDGLSKYQSTVSIGVLYAFTSAKQ